MLRTQLLSVTRLRHAGAWMPRPPCWAAGRPWGTRGLPKVAGTGRGDEEIVEFTADMLKHDSLQAATGAAADQPKPLRLQKRSVALHIGYVGTAYHGARPKLSPRHAPDARSAHAG